MVTEEQYQKFLKDNKLDPKLVEGIKQFIGYTNEDIMLSTPRQHKSWKAQYKLNEWLLLLT